MAQGTANYHHGILKVTREAEDRLTRETWVFAFPEAGGCVLRAYSYHERVSRRRHYHAVPGRYWFREVDEDEIAGQLPTAEVPLPGDILGPALGAVTVETQARQRSA